MKNVLFHSRNGNEWPCGLMDVCFILGSKEVFKNSKTDTHLQFRMKIIYDLRLPMIPREMMGLALQLVVFLWVRKLKASG